MMHGPINIRLQFLSLCRLPQLAKPSRLTVVLVSLMLAAPAVIFWLKLVIQPARVAILCPEECWCYPGGYHVDYLESSINSVPLILPTNTRRLALNDSRITSLEKDAFVSRGLTELEEFVAKFVQIATIEMGAFNGFTSLKNHGTAV